MKKARSKITKMPIWIEGWLADALKQRANLERRTIPVVAAAAIAPYSERPVKEDAQ
jgi:hypothetical protein